MTKRPGITLIEVLVAIFIMAIGLLALLTLFPLGALRMSQALQDDRASSCASSGANICDVFNIRQDGNADFIHPARATDPATGFQFPPLTASSGGGFPVWVDPYGMIADATNTPLGDFNVVTQPNPPTPGIRRITPANIPVPFSNNASLTAPRYFTLLDDMTFLTSGLPDTGTPAGSTPLQRGDRYTWGLMLHRLSPFSSPTTSLTVVVYAGRATALPGGESTYTAAGAFQDTQVILTHNGTAPTIRRGTWILDTSYEVASNSVHGDFYRVVAVTPVASNPNQVSLELQNPISKPGGITAVTVMDNVVEVFERGTNTSDQWEFHTQKN